MSARRPTDGPGRGRARSARPLLFALLLLAGTAAGCRRGGGEGAPCQRPADCRRGFRCEEQRCLGGPESPCGYLLRCLPLLRPEEREPLFGENIRQQIEALTQRPDQAVCAARLNLIAQLGRTVVLNRACGPRVDH